VKKLDQAMFNFALLFLGAVLAACTRSLWQNDPAVEAARKACQSASGIDYNCVERQAVNAMNPDICRLLGIAVDDACLQTVYEAANDPAICDRIYLPGVVPNCRAFYARFTPQVRGSETPRPVSTAIPSLTPLPTLAPTSLPSPVASPTPP